MDKLSEILIKLGLFSPISVLPLRGAGAVISKAGALATSGAKFVKGLKQKAKAKKINDDRINKTMNEEVLRNTATARNSAYAPDAASSRARENVQQGVASTVTQAKTASNDGGGVLSAITASNQAAGQTERDIATDESTRKGSLMKELAAARTAQSKERDVVFNDKVAARDERVAEKKGLLDAAAANKMEGAKGMIAAGAKLAGGDKGAKALGGVLGNLPGGKKPSSKIGIPK
tara:strand:+ start:3373 stop:4071 length:699 start_codon:yes stop_codon:yes gene_type:complete